MSDAPRDQAAQSVEIARAFRALMDRKWVIVALMVLGFAGALVLSMQTTPRYQATAKILRQTTTLDQALFGAQIFQISDQERALITGADLVRLDAVAQKVKQELGSPRSPQSLGNMITTRPNSTANIIDIVATSTDSSEPADVANSFARQFITYRQQADRTVLANARAQVEAELKAMTQSEAASARGQTLSQKVEELAVLESLQTGGYELVQAARAPSVAYNIHTYRNAAVGLVLGLIVGLIAASLLHLLDRRIKDEDVFEREFGLPVIARIPLVGRRWSGTRGRRSSAPVGFNDRGSLVLEAFRTLRSNLKFFEVDRVLGTILVTSPLPREGKSVTAVNLALSLAMSGSRVILLEADLRRPMLNSYLGLDGHLGFSDLLSGTRTVSEVVQVLETTRFLPQKGPGARVPDQTVAPTAHRDLLYVSAGPLPPNPAELLATDRTADVFKQLTAVCDYVIIDAPPVLLVSDALEIAKKVDGVILVSRLRATRIDEARRTRQSLERIGVKPLGVIVSGVMRAKAYYRRYGGYYAKT
jgi:Mrp family chromosome partitioning ATPase/capsular polysaccharide biosynthesis protein